MSIEDRSVSQAILETFHQDLMENLKVDVAIAGAGPAGLTAGYFLSKKGHDVALFERALKPGGGMWGGGMMFNHIVVQEEAKYLLEEFEIECELYEEDYLTADAVEAAGALISQTCQAGAKIVNLLEAEDVLLEPGPERVKGLVLNWTSVELSGLHVDPIAIEADQVIDATGHDTEVVCVLEEKNDISLDTSAGSRLGEKSMAAAQAEEDTLRNTGEVYPGLHVAGMAANATRGSYRMGPIFGGMLMSGEKVAEKIAARL